MEEYSGPRVRSRTGLIPWRTGASTLQIREWREKQFAAGEPHSLSDYMIAHGICLECLGHGAVMVGWSCPVTPVDQQAAEEFGVEQLPLYEVCASCKGIGNA